MQQMGSATAAARVEMGALDGSTGMMLGGLARMAGQSSALAPLISAAFPIFGALAFGEVIAGVADKIEEMLDKPAKIRQDWQDLSNTLVSADESIEKSIEGVTAKTIELSQGPIPALRYQIDLLRDSAGRLDETVGKSFTDIEKILKEANLSSCDPSRMLGEGTSSIQKELKAALPDIQQTLNTEGARAGLEKIDALLFKLMDERNAIEKQSQTQEFDKAKLDALNQTIAAMQKIRVLTDEQGQLNDADKAEKQKAIGKAIEDVDRENAKSRIESKKKVQLAAVDSAEAILKAKREMGIVSATDAIAQERALESQKLKIQTDALNSEIALTKRLPTNEPSKDVTKIADLNDEIASLKSAHLGKMAGLDAEANKESDKTALARIEATEIVAKAAASSEEQLGLARISQIKNQVAAIQESTKLRSAKETADSSATLTKLGGERDVHADDPNLTVKIDAQIEAEKKRHEAAMATIAAEGAAKESDARMQSIDREVSANAEAANMQLESSMRMDEQRLSHHQSTLGATIQAETGALNRWLAVNLQALNIALDFAESAYGKESQQYQKLQQDKSRLDQEYSEKLAAIQQKASEGWQRTFQVINGPLQTAVGAMLNGSERASIAFARMGSSILTSGVNAVVQWAVKTAEQIIVVEVLEHSSLARRIVAHTTALTAKLGAEQAALTAEIGQMTAGAAAKQAVTSTVNSSTVVSAAGAAAAAAVASAFETVPFPASLAVAPAAGIAALAEVMAYLPMASAERGGIMGDSPTMTLLHPREMVLPERISQSVQRMAAGGGSDSSSGDVHHHYSYSPQVSAIDARGVSEVLQAHSEDFYRMIRRGVRNGQLGFNR